MSTTARPEAVRAVRPSFLRSTFRFHTVLGASLILLVALFCAPSVGDPDIWWHLENARQFVTTGHFATQDLYSFTALHSPWINHEWLAELPYYGAYRAFGLQGLFGLTLLLLTIIVLATLHLAYRESDNIKGAFLWGVLAVMLSVVNFGPRTILFGWLFLLILLRILQRIRNDQPGPWWAIPLLFLLWVNTHGSWLIGIAVFALIAVPGFLPDIGGLNQRWSTSQRKQLLFGGILTVPALFLNPYGYRLVFYPFDMAFKQKLNIGHVEEWASVDFHTPRGIVALIMLLATLAAFGLSRMKPRMDEWLIVLFALYTSLSHIRFLFLAAILLAPIIVRRITFTPPYQPEIDKPRLNLAIVAGILIAILWRFPSAATLQTDLSKNYPIGAIRFLQSNAPHKRIFNDYVWGGYLIWSARELPTFVDGRADIFEWNGTLKDYLDVVSIEKPFEILDRQKIDFVLFRPDTPLSYLLDHSPNWRRVYSDQQSVVFARTSTRY